MKRIHIFNSHRAIRPHHIVLSSILLSSSVIAEDQHAPPVPIPDALIGEYLFEPCVADTDAWYLDVGRYDAAIRDDYFGISVIDSGDIQVNEDGSIDIDTSEVPDAPASIQLKLIGNRYQMTVDWPAEEWYLSEAPDTMDVYKCVRPDKSIYGVVGGF